jgi:hypothetical protein
MQDSKNPKIATGKFPSFQCWNCRLSFFEPLRSFSCSSLLQINSRNKRPVMMCLVAIAPLETPQTLVKNPVYWKWISRMHVCIHVSETQHNVQEGHSKITHKLDFCSQIAPHFGLVKSGSAYTFFVSRITLLLLGHCMKELRTLPLSPLPQQIFGSASFSDWYVCACEWEREICMQTWFRVGQERNKDG